MAFAIVPKKRVWLGKISLTGVYFSLCAAFLLWGLESTRLLRSLDDLVYDACLRSVSSIVDVPAHVLLLDGPFGEEQLDGINADGTEHSTFVADEELLSACVSKLSRLNARAIGITFPIPNELAWKLQTIHRQIAFVGSEQCKDVTEPSPRDVLASSGAILRPLNGVYRDHFVHCSESEPRSLEAEVADYVILERNELPGSLYRVFFRGGADSLPHVDSESLRNDHLTEDLVAGKAVLIGVRSLPSSARWPVPTTNYALGMTPLEFRGHALNTLLINRPIRRQSRWFTLFLTMAAALIGQYVFRRVNVRMAAAMFVAIIVAVLGVAWILLAWLHLWIPCVPLAAIFTFCFAVAAEMRLTAAGAALQMLRLRCEEEASKPRSNGSLLVEDDPWTDLVDLTFQMFYLRRLVILELPSGSDHLVPVKFVNCDTTDIEERRRDYGRLPYSESLRNGPAQPNSSRRFFIQDDPQDVEFLVPLTFGGQVVGFLAVSLHTSVLEESPDFDNELDSLAKEIALLIAQYRTKRAERRSMHSLAGRLIERVPEDELFEEIEEAAQVTKRRNALLDDVFQSSETASAIYDAFGQLVIMNKAMFRALQDKGALPAQLTALEAMTFLTHDKTSDCRDKLRRTIIDGRQQAILIDLKDDAATSVLHVRPVSSGGATSHASDPFEVQGIHFELVDTSVLNQVQSAKRRLVENVFGTLESDLQRLKMSVSDLGVSDLPQSRFDDLRRKLAQELSSSISNVTSYKGFLSKKASNDADEFLPIDAISVLKNSIQTTRSAAQAREIKVESNLPEHECDVLANPHLLRISFELTLQWIIQEARDESVIRIDCDDAITDLVIRYENKGAGTLTDRLRDCLDGKRATNADEFRRLRELQSWFTSWGSRLAIQSDGEDGLVVEMHLKRHQWSTDGMWRATDLPKRGEASPAIQEEGGVK